MKRKLLAVVDTYLDAAAQPSCQVDISADLHDRSVKALRRHAASLEFNPNLLEEVNTALMNAHIYPYYAGFRRTHSEAPETEESVLVQRKS